MPSLKAILSASAIAFFSSTSAHMKLDNPKPYGSPNNSPLEASGSDFPCKTTSNTDGPVNEMAIGAPQQLSFIGSAVHGGGSCQISLTKDNPATKASKWMVIHSIEGGCPAREQAGNAGTVATVVAPDKYDYKIPEGIAPGTYTLAWTWFNKVGNREMYMNCANVKVTGGSSKRDIYHNETYAIPQLTERQTPSFPEMFVANAPVTDCQTVPNQDVKFPDPGKSVAKEGGASTLAPPTGPKCGGGSGGGQSTGDQAASGGSDSGSSSGSGSGSGSGAGSGSDSGSDSGAGSGSGSGADAGSGSGAGSGSDSDAGSGSEGQGTIGGIGGTGSVAAVSIPAGPAPSSAPSSAPMGGSNSSGSSSTGSTPPPPTDSTATSCTTPGQSICSPDGKQIGTCDQTMKAVMQPVPAATICKSGMIQWPRRARTVRRSWAIGGWQF